MLRSLVGSEMCIRDRVHAMAHRFGMRSHDEFWNGARCVTVERTPLSSVPVVALSELIPEIVEGYPHLALHPSVTQLHQALQVVGERRARAAQRRKRLRGATPVLTLDPMAAAFVPGGLTPDSIHANNSSPDPHPHPHPQNSLPEPVQEPEVVPLHLSLIHI
eukprot:TRINITY_DN61198_c0_g1_i2.p1 TRINITY_DN61198_c0_g1~~TRINITY_DN61198_c0_g1_i2.p1  ORF type:complete len:162 (+),score=42.58 TRINITY_DN61198_c0_g1_i2:76-561(+)